MYLYNLDALNCNVNLVVFVKKKKDFVKKN